jgi:hypothetical protein
VIADLVAAEAARLDAHTDRPAHQEAAAEIRTLVTGRGAVDDEA